MPHLHLHLHWDATWSTSIKCRIFPKSRLDLPLALSSVSWHERLPSAPQHAPRTAEILSFIIVSMSILSRIICSWTGKGGSSMTNRLAKRLTAAALMRPEGCARPYKKRLCTLIQLALWARFKKSKTGISDAGKLCKTILKQANMRVDSTTTAQNISLDRSKNLQCQQRNA